MSAMLIAALLVAAPSYAERIVLSTDLECESCDLSLSPSEVGTLYVLATSNISGALVGGAEFRVVGFPEEWVVTATRSPESHIEIGDPLGGGVNIGFPSGQPRDCSLLYTLEIFATTLVEDLEVSVVAHEIPSNVNLDCPRIFYSCGPCDIWICAAGSVARINSGNSCLVSVEEVTWSAVKELFRR